MLTFAATLNRERWARVFQKGIDREIDSYSGFFDNGRVKDTGLGSLSSATGSRLACSYWAWPPTIALNLRHWMR